MDEHERSAEMLARRRELDAGEEHILAHHLAGCVRCRETAAAYAQQTAALRAQPVVTPPPSVRAGVLARVAAPRPLPWWRRIPAALPAGMVAAAAIVILAFFLRGNGGKTPQHPVASGPASPTVTFGPATTKPAVQAPTAVPRKASGKDRSARPAPRPTSAPPPAPSPVPTLIPYPAPGSGVAQVQLTPTPIPPSVFGTAATVIVPTAIYSTAGRTRGAGGSHPPINGTAKKHEPVSPVTAGGAGPHPQPPAPAPRPPTAAPPSTLPPTPVPAPTHPIAVAPVRPADTPTPVPTPTTGPAIATEPATPTPSPTTGAVYRAVPMMTPTATPSPTPAP